MASNQHMQRIGIRTRSFGVIGNKGSGKGPLRSFKEMAEEFGVNYHALVIIMRHSPVTPPTPELRNRAGFWYRPSLMRQWWKDHQAATKPLDAAA